jgi:TolB protein
VPRLLFALVVVALAGVAVHAEPRAASPQRIVFAATLAPKLSGEIYRVDPNGRRLDLSRSSFQDTHPLVSTDGRTVAFVSDRAGAPSVYEIGVDGTGLRRVGPTLPREPQDPQLAWQPHGNRLALVSGTAVRLTLWILRPGHKPLAVVHDAGLSAPGWSPDGRVVTTTLYDHVRIHAYSPAGMRLWDAPSLGYGSSWSAGGLLAAKLPAGGIAVYDERGHRRFSTPGRAAAWSPDGAHLAVLAGRDVAVYTASGTRTLTKRIPGLAPDGANGLRWAGSNRVAVGGLPPGNGTSGVDLRTGRLWTPPAFWFGTLSADGSLAIETPVSGTTVSLRVVPTAGGAGMTYARLPGCYDDGGVVAAEAPQFVPSSRALVYASSCPEPFDNLWAVAPDGSGLRRVTAVGAEQAWPTLSPDGSRIAYGRSRYTGLSCKGCPAAIHVVGVDGRGDRALTTPGYTTYDVAPTWSPDGTRILFSRSTAQTPGELMVVPAAGGATRDLHVEGDQPAWGPSRIAYTTPNAATPALWTAKPDGSDPQRVANGPFGSPAWSADGRLAYLASRFGTTVIVGSTRTKLPFDRVVSLAWSPDGTRFVVTARPSPTTPYDVYTVATDGTGLRRLTHDLDASNATWR